MTYQDDFTLPTELLEQVAEQGLDFLPELIRIVDLVFLQCGNAWRYWEAASRLKVNRARAPD